MLGAVNVIDRGEISLVDAGEVLFAFDGSGHAREGLRPESGVAATSSAVAARSVHPPLDDIARMWRYAREHGVAADIKRLHRPRLWVSLASAASDWVTILGVFALMLVWPWAAPLALVVTGNRQRALGNLLHDAAHGSFGRNRRLADALTLWLLFRPLWVSLAIYRREHFAHHRLLGLSGHDVDLIHREQDMGSSWLMLLWRHAASPENWMVSIFAHLPRAGFPEIVMMLAAGSGGLAALACLARPSAALEFAALWFVSRATTFHLITTFREISDHVGLTPGTLMGFSRNHTSGGLLGQLFHPHNNGYHLVHHLNPGMPFHALPRAHRLLLAWPEYAAATHSDRYFFGRGALTGSWVRARDAGSAAKA